MDLFAQQNSQTSYFPTISVEIDISGGNVDCNFRKLAEEKYGLDALDALHPEGSRLRDSGKISDDEESDSDAPNGPTETGDGDELMHDATNTEEGGATETKVTSPAVPVKKKRKRKEDAGYDVNDPFIDDDELFMQEDAAASKDGFFVFSGPLIPEGDKVKVERADGTTKRGGKGSRGGRGSRAAGKAKGPTQTRTKSVPETPLRESILPFPESPLSAVDSSQTPAPIKRVVKRKPAVEKAEKDKPADGSPKEQKVRKTPAKRRTDAEKEKDKADKAEKMKLKEIREREKTETEKEKDKADKAEKMKLKEIREREKTEKAERAAKESLTVNELPKEPSGSPGPMFKKAEKAAKESLTVNELPKEPSGSPGPMFKKAEKAAKESLTAKELSKDPSGSSGTMFIQIIQSDSIVPNVTTVKENVQVQPSPPRHIVPKLTEESPRIPHLPPIFLTPPSMTIAHDHSL